MILKVIQEVKRAGNITEAHHITDVQEKSYANYVTDVDREVEEFLSEQLTALLPGSLVYGEEGQRHIGSEYIWIIDPIDGTTNYIHGQNNYAISVALAQLNPKTAKHEVILGVVYEPAIERLFYAFEGKAYMEFKEKKTLLTSSSKEDVQGAVGAFGWPYDKSRSVEVINTLNKLSPQVADLKRTGPASVDICLVAAGQLDFYYELDLESWDLGAAIYILECAGGKWVSLSKHNEVFCKEGCSSNQQISRATERPDCSLSVIRKEY